MIDRVQQVYDIIAANEPISERQIASRAGLKKTPYLAGIIRGLMREGFVSRMPGVSGNRACYLYAIARREDAS